MASDISSLNPDYQRAYGALLKAGLDPQTALQSIQQHQQDAQTKQQADQEAHPRDVGIAEKIANALPLIGGVAGSFTPLGPIFGGAAGGAGGSALKSFILNHDADPSNDVETGQAVANAAGEGLLSGVGGVVGKVGGAALRGVGQVVLPGVTKALTGGVQEGADVLSRSIANGGKALSKSVVPPIVNAGPNGFATEEALNNWRMANGFKGSAGNQYKQLGEKMGEFSGQLKTALADNTTPVNSADILKGMFQEIDQNPGVIGDKTAVQDAKQLMMQQVNKAFGVTTPKTITLPEGTIQNVQGTVAHLAEAKQALGEYATKIFDKVAKGTPLKPGEEAYLSGWEAIDNQITKLAPEVKDITMNQSQLYKLAPGIYKARAGGNLPFMSGVIPALSGTIGATKDMAGRALIGVAKDPGMIATIAGQNIVHPEAIADSTGLGAQPADVASPTQNVNGTLSDANIGGASSSNVTQQTADSTASADSTAPSSPGSLTNEQIGHLMIADLAATGGKNISNLQAIAKYLVPAATTPPKVSATQATQLVQGNSALKKLDQLDALSKTVKNTGRMQILKQGVRGVTGDTGGLTANTDNEEAFKTQSNALLSTYVQMLSGAAASDQERTFIQNYLPGLQFTPQENKVRIAGARQAIKDQMAAIGTVSKNTTVVSDLQATP